MTFNRQWIKEALFCLCLGIGTFLIILLASGCKTGVPAVQVNFWAGNSAQDAITRSQDGTSIQCSSPGFDDYVALTYDDLKKLYSLMLHCRDWDPGISEETTESFLARNQDVFHRMQEKGLLHARRVALQKPCSHE